MPRRRRCRWVWFEPRVTYFGPGWETSEVNLTVDELEAMRLSDLEGLDQKEAAKRMNISQPTFSRLLKSARKKVAQSLVEGKGLRIEGGEYKVVRGIPMRRFLCYNCGHKWEVPYGAPRPAKCPKCGSTNIHRAPEDRGYARRGPRWMRA
ncbi:MAG: DUF134 domain-containing protein [Nanoarchaeota archaeon]|nr:DUF134 domain-containing protein [Nanoarchaeota archaeon]